MVAVADVPKWLDSAFIEKVVQDKVVSTHIVPAVAKGECFASSLFRVRATLSDGKETSIIVKMPADAGDVGGQDLDARFPMEARVYCDILPAMLELLKSVGRDEPLGPRILHSQNDPQLTLVLEDLVAPGYKMVDRRELLDLDHMLLVVRNLARFHASSVVLHDRNPKLYDGLRPMVGEYQGDAMRTYFVKGWEYFTDDVETWNDELSRRVVPKMRAMTKGFLERIWKTWRPDETKFNVLNHGDLWSNNILFKYDANGKPESVRFIDFQLGSWQTPAADLHYLFLSASESLRQDRGKTLLEAYHKELDACLRDMGIPGSRIPTLQDLQIEMQDRAFMQLPLVAVHLPMYLAPKSVELTFAVLVLDQHDGPGENPRRATLREPTFRRMARRELLAWEKEGIL